VYQEPNVNVSGIAPANPYGGQGCSADSTTGDPDVTLPRLDWLGRHAFTARYAVQPAVDPILGARYGPRHDQSVLHHFTTVDSPTGLVYAYDLTWDEYAVLATDVPRAAVEAALGRARAIEKHPTLEAFAGLLADSLTAPTPHDSSMSLDADTSNEMAAGVEL